MLSDEEINDVARQIEALEPRTKEVVLRYLDFLVQVQEIQEARLAGQEKDA